MWRIGTAVMALVLGACGAAQAADVEGLRLWAGPDKTRAVLDLSGNVEYRLFTLTGPDRVVIDIENSRLASDLGSEGDGKLIDGVRSGKRGKNDLRVVFDLKQTTRPKSFLLDPAAQYGHRLVVDLYPDTAAEKPRTIKAVMETDRDIIVAVDAGHGGEDPGAIGPAGTYEKDIVLSIAKKTAAMINQRQGFRGVLVRTGDYYIPHRQRPGKARKMRADLFLSIHADGFHDKRVKGASVFYLSRGRATSEAAQYLADRENASDLVGGVSLSDKEETLAAVLLDLSQGASIEASKEVGRKVHAALADIVPTHKPHIEGASFAVLTAPDIPSLLIETGFITNPQEERRLRTDKSQYKLARAIVNGVEDYFYSHPPPATWLANNRIRGSHVVARGETLSGIAVKHKVSLKRLRDVNNIQGDMLRIGAVLRIPGA